MSQWLWRLISYSKYMSTISYLGFFSIPPSLLDPGWEKSLYLKYFSRCSRGKNRYSESQTDSKGFCLRETHHDSAHHSLAKAGLVVPPGLDRACMHNPPTGMGAKGSSRMNRDEETDPLAISEREWIRKRRERAEPREHPVLHLWYFVLWSSVSLDGQPKRRCWEIRWWIHSGQGEPGVPLRHWSDSASWGCWGRKSE